MAGKEKGKGKKEKETSEVVKEDVVEKENNTLIWFFVVVGFVFAAFLIPYIWVEESKSFEFSDIDWVIEDYENLRIYHGRFLSLTNHDLHYNIFLRGDPRENDVETIGTFDEFKYGVFVSLGPEAEKCRGDLSRSMLDLGAFLKQGIGAGPVVVATNDEAVSLEQNRTLVTCENTLDRTVVVVRAGESKVVQDEANPNCYTIYAEDCEDIAPVEKFIVKAIGDFRTSNPLEVEE